LEYQRKFNFDIAIAVAELRINLRFGFWVNEDSVMRTSETVLGGDA
jgi:hypothetical protein